MVPVIFAILKFIGLLFLGIFLFMLLVILLVMLSPLKYRIKGKGDKEEDISGEAKVSWLLGIIKILVTYNQKENPIIDIKLFGIPITNRKKKKKTKKKRKRKKGKQNKQKKQKKQKKQTNTPFVQDPPKEQTLHTREKTNTYPPEVPRKKIVQPPKIESIPMQMPKQKTGVRRVKIDSIKEEPIDPEILKLDEKIMGTESMPNKSEAEKSTDEKSGSNKTKIDLLHTYWRKFQEVEDKKGMMKGLKKLFKRMITGILPENLKIKAKIGLTEPSLTGQFMGFVGILTAKFGDNIKITPDFTQTTIEDIEIEVKGKIIFGYFLYAMIAFVLAKPIKRQLWKLWKGRKQHE